MNDTKKAFANSEYATVREVLLCVPALHMPTPGKQVFAAPQLASQQHRYLVQALTDEGVVCRFIESDPQLPYQCYTRDSCVITPWGLLVTRMGFTPRKAEQDAMLRYAKASETPIWQQVSVGSLEGGDVMLIRPGLVLIGVNGVRTTRAAAEQVAHWFEAEGWSARIVEYPTTFRHLDILVGVVGSHDLLCATDALHPADLAWLRVQGYHLHTVPLDECRTMACNTLNLGDGRVVTHARNAFVNQYLSGLGVRTVPVDISEYADDDGGVHCLVQALVRDAATTLNRADLLPLAGAFHV
ncbi:dimethylarginine dimethylaminohydrolase family protein [Pseudomonas sp. KBS0710]|uniref:dimethylarginine dimethylaminohydrolase family protein n=1 Tax=Pseudomonas sp. KBS0710 TaxID=1179667 RepID=UPI0015B73962|nr:arginine deiminase family protein [Pseudomonas sp. KBS0710]